MGAPAGFAWKHGRKRGEIVIAHYGKKATILRGSKAADFVESVETLSLDDQQQLMARLTGNYKRGNERDARNHPRNRDR